MLQGSIFVSVRVTVDSECAEGNRVIRNTNMQIKVQWMKMKSVVDLETVS